MAATDPVCDMIIEEDEAAGTTEYDATTYYFCSAECQEEFEADPEAYV